MLFFLISIPEKEMGDLASPRAAAAAPCGFTLCFFVLAVFKGGSGAILYATAVACTAEADFGGSGGDGFCVGSFEGLFFSVE